MRDIRFRGKRLDTGEWVYGYLFQAENAWWIQEKPLENTFNDIQTFIMGSEAVLRIVAYQVDSKTVGQYTELKDKDGTEIYEGDIVYSDEYDKPFIIEYAEDWSCFAYSEAMAITDRILSIDRACLYSDVIGNIYENPELLEGVE